MCFKVCFFTILFFAYNSIRRCAVNRLCKCSSELFCNLLYKSLTTWNNVLFPFPQRTFFKSSFFQLNVFLLRAGIYFSTRFASDISAITSLLRREKFGRFTNAKLNNVFSNITSIWKRFELFILFPPAMLIVGSGDMQVCGCS